MSLGSRIMSMLKEIGREKREGRVCGCLPSFQPKMVRCQPGHTLGAWMLRNAHMFTHITGLDRTGAS